jgi:hypothetical protein
MKRGLLLALLLWLLPALSAVAQTSVTAYPAPWGAVGGTVTLSVTNTSGNVQLGWAAVSPLPAPPPPAAWVCNTGANAAYVLLGNSGVSVTTSTGFYVAPGVCNLIAIGPSTNQYLAGITASSTTSLTISTGYGSPLSGMPGGGAGALTPIANGTVLGNSSGGFAFPSALSTLPSGLTIPGATITTPTITGLASVNGYVPSFGVLFSSAGPPTAAGTGYVPGEVITLTGGTATTQATVVPNTTQAVSATVQTAGSGGSNGACTVTGTTGTGTKAQFTGTVSGGVLTGPLTVAVAGNYSANPTDITQEPVTGCSLTGAKVAMVMGINTFQVQTPGRYSTLPANIAAVAQGSTTGSGTGATFPLTFGPIAADVPFGASSASVSNVNLVRFGQGALSSNTTGVENTGVGWGALQNNTTGGFNTAFGLAALFSSVTPGNNSAFGADACKFYLGTNGQSISCFGASAGKNWVLGGGNTFVGNQAAANATGNDGPSNSNTCVGDSCMLGSSSTVTQVARNSAFGSGSLSVIASSGKDNTTLGANSGNKITSGQNNSIFGSGVASTTLATGTNNLILGTNSSCDTAAGSTANTIALCAGSTAIWSATGTGTPSTSASTIAGNLSVVAALGLPTTNFADNATCATANQFLGASATFLYICTASNTVGRIAISAF